jgi:hypothetical protein
VNKTLVTSVQYARHGDSVRSPKYHTTFYKCLLKEIRQKGKTVEVQYENRAGRDGERKQTKTGRLKERVGSTGCVLEQDVEEGTLK